MARRIPYAVRWIMDRTHIATPYTEVADEIAERIDRNNPDPDRIERARLITLALIQHRRNGAEYAEVMGR